MRRNAQLIRLPASAMHKPKTCNQSKMYCIVLYSNGICSPFIQLIAHQQSGLRVTVSHKRKAFSPGGVQSFNRAWK